MCTWAALINEPAVAPFQRAEVTAVPPHTRGCALRVGTGFKIWNYVNFRILLENRSCERERERERERFVLFVCLLVGCLTSQQHASVSQGRICTDRECCTGSGHLPTFKIYSTQRYNTARIAQSLLPLSAVLWAPSCHLVPSGCVSVLRFSVALWKYHVTFLLVPSHFDDVRLNHPLPLLNKREKKKPTQLSKSKTKTKKSSDFGIFFHYI